MALHGGIAPLACGPSSFNLAVKHQRSNIESAPICSGHLLTAYPLLPCRINQASTLVVASLWILDMTFCCFRSREKLEMTSNEPGRNLACFQGSKRLFLIYYSKSTSLNDERKSAYKIGAWGTINYAVIEKCDQPAQWGDKKVNRSAIWYVTCNKRTTR